MQAITTTNRHWNADAGALRFSAPAEQPGADALTDALCDFHIRASHLYCARLSAPWGLGFDPRSCAEQSGGSDADFHVVTDGACYLDVDGTDGPPLLLRAGDLAVLPRGTPHRLRDAPHTPTVALSHLIGASGDGAGFGRDASGALLYGGGGTETRLICGKFFFPPGGELHPLLHDLPPLLLVRGDASETVTWLRTTLDFAACESGGGRPGAQTILGRLGEILFIQALRAHMTAQTCPVGGSDNLGQSSWLRALSDARIGPVLQSVHRDPAHKWTVANLAERAYLSRSAFASRFCALVGEPPLAYVTRWRMHAAARLLRADPAAPLAYVAARVGYDSEAHFSRAFKQATGCAPGAWRKR